ncbi:hypothetical protein VSR72_36490 [Paraburkholderia sp. JHI869]
MAAAALLDRLDGVRSCGNGRWRARCPACRSGKAVLAITETADGTTLLHCFREGCPVADIANAAGIDLADLFPPRFDGVHASKPAKRRFNAQQVLGAVNVEILEILIVLSAVLHRGSMTPTEYERLRLAVSRVSVAEGLTNV